jgi:hypothetical protein
MFLSSETLTEPFIASAVSSDGVCCRKDGEDPGSCCFLAFFSFSWESAQGAERIVTSVVDQQDFLKL